MNTHDFAARLAARQLFEALVALRDRPLVDDDCTVAVPLHGRPLDEVATDISLAWQVENPKEVNS